MIAHILNAQSKTVTFGAFLLIGSSLISSMLGLFRDRLLASRFGAGQELDMYFAAFRIPDFLFGILVIGGLSAAFLPIFSEYAQKDKSQALKFAGDMLNVVILVLGIASIFLFFEIPFFIRLIVPGFSIENQMITASLTRFMLLSPLLFGISAVISSILQYYNKFFAYALAPLLYNLGIIGGIVFLVPNFGIFGLAQGVVFGALLHLCIQIIPVFSTGFRFHPFSFSERIGVLRVCMLALPRTLGAGATYVSPIIMTAFASSFAVGSIAVFSFANNVQGILVGVIGISFSFAAFPYLARTFSDNQTFQFAKVFSGALRQIVFLALPCSFLLFLLRAQIVRLILGTGKFGWEDTRLTSAVLGIFAAGIIFQALIPFFMRTFFSLQNTKIPAISSILALFINAFGALFFVRVFEGSSTLEMFMKTVLRIEDIPEATIIALPFALVLGSIFQCVFLGIGLQKRIPVFSKEIGKALLKICIASLMMACGTYAGLKVFGTLFELRTFGELFLQAVLATLFGVFVFFISVAFLRCQELKEFVVSFKQQFYDK